MKFIIEAAGLTVAGGKELALDLMTRLAGHAEHHFTFIVPDLNAYKVISGSNIRTIVCKKGSGLLHRARLLNYDIPEICRAEGADALLCLGNFAPWKPVCPTAVLLQNAWIVYRDPFAESRRTLREHLITAYGRNAYRHLPRGLTIITQTQIMKDHLCQRYGIDGGQVAIIPNTLSLARLGGHRDRAPFGRNEGRPTFTFLCLAHYYAHKNIDILLDAVRRLADYTGKPAKCVVTVAPHQHNGARRLLERLNRHDFAGKIENIGPVASEKLPAVYLSADALVFPTLLESFSRTYLEALHFQLPILTSDRDFARHLCRDAAIYFDPLNAASVARTMARMMEDSGLRQRLVENGKGILAQAPTWEKIAARFVEVLERTARGEPVLAIKPRSESGDRHLADSWDLQAPRASAIAPSPQHRGLVISKGKGSWEATTAYDIRTLFNQKAHRWPSKYGPKGKLNSRIKQFAVRLAELCPPPANILDLGCGTGEIAAAIDQMGYRVTACDLAEEMIDIARSSHLETSVEWICLEPGEGTHPFADGSFDGIVASSVFEYLDDVHSMAADLARVLRPEGVLLLTVPNPCNVVRKLEVVLSSTLLNRPLPPLLRRVQRIDSYAAYLRLSRNRFDGRQWQAVMNAASFAAVDGRDFSPETWQRQAKSPLVLLAVKKVVEPTDVEGELKNIRTTVDT